MIEVIVKYTPEQFGTAKELRRIVYGFYMTQPVGGGDPFEGSTFNQLLGDIAQTAFDEGRSFEKSQPAKQ